jgi:adenylate kinase family enzyme
LGARLEKRGLKRQRCHHFDFGANLRAIAASGKSGQPLTLSEVNFIKNILKQDALLANRDFYLARKILSRFIIKRRVRPGDWIILNGLPRHTGQAKQIKSLIEIKSLIYLDCPPKTVLARIRHNRGGDRSGRPDDAIASIKNKLAVFSRKTEALLKYYRSAGVEIIKIPVFENTRPGDIIKILIARRTNIY